MTREEAVKSLIDKRQVTTGMLDALGLDMEDFLKLAQLDDINYDIIISKLIAHYTNNGWRE